MVQSLRFGLCYFITEAPCLFMRVQIESFVPYSLHVSVLQRSSLDHLLLIYGSPPGLLGHSELFPSMRYLAQLHRRLYRVVETLE